MKGWLARLKNDPRSLKNDADGSSFSSCLVPQSSIHSWGKLLSTQNPFEKKEENTTNGDILSPANQENKHQFRARENKLRLSLNLTQIQYRETLLP